MDFLEFVVSIVNFCSLSPETLCNFTFDLYDLDNDGEISYDEIETMVRELYGASWDTSQLARDALRDMALLSEKYGGGIPLDGFIRFQKQHGLLLFPCFVIQRNIQQKVGHLVYHRPPLHMLQACTSKILIKSRYSLPSSLGPWLGLLE